MAADRFVLLGLGTTRSAWFVDVARWATVGALPVEFVKCVSGEDLRVRLASGRPFSGVLVDAATGAVDRDLLDLADRHRAAVLVVGPGPAPAGTWTDLGAAAVLPADLGREQLLDALVAHCRPIGAAVDLPGADPAGADPTPAGDGTDRRRGRLVAVTGRGGTGRSTVALALAQGLATRPPGDVVVADLCLDADLAMLHDVRDVVPGVQELVEAHRHARPSAPEVRSGTFAVVHRGYHLLLGLRRHQDWAVVRPRTFAAALDGLGLAFATVVADVDDDVEGEAECGAVEVEERNVMARTTLGRADLVVAVGGSGVRGLHALVRTLDRLVAHGVEATRILPVVNGAPRSPRGRAEMTRALAALVSVPRTRGPGPLHLPRRRGLDDLHRDGARLPAALAAPLAAAVSDLLARAPGPTPTPVDRPVPVEPGRLGTGAAGAPGRGGDR